MTEVRFSREGLSSAVHVRFRELEPDGEVYVNADDVSLYLKCNPETDGAALWAFFEREVNAAKDGVR